MALELLCRKLGMSRVFTEEGACIPVTVLEAGPNFVLQQKTQAREGYNALQLGFGARAEDKVSQPMQGHFKKAGADAARFVKECRVDEAALEAHAVGAEIRADIFSEGQRVDAVGHSKGRGTAGVVKRYGFKVKRWTHGTHEGRRRPGSIGAGAYPGKVFKGKRMAGRMGNARATARNLQVVRVDLARNLLLVKGAVPGHNNGLVALRPAAS